jgi:pteridine reductase
MNKIALITGGAKRIGALISQFLHEQGFSIAMHCNTSLAEATLLNTQFNKQRKNSSCLVQADLRDANDYQKIINAVVDQFGRLDVVIHNASVFYPTPIEEATLENWDHLLNINVKAPFFLTQAAAPVLRKYQGCIVNITDVYAQKPLKFYNIYNISKAALKMMTETLAKELAPHVRVNAVAPGSILWPENMDLLLQAKILQKIPLKRQGIPLDIAKAIWFLIDSPYVTGQTIIVDGGKSI